MELLLDGRTKIFFQMVQVTGPRWSPCPYMVKPFINFLLRKNKADYLETWYAALGAKVVYVIGPRDQGRGLQQQNAIGEPGLSMHGK